jgi:hypothetical protein
MPRTLRLSLTLAVAAAAPAVAAAQSPAPPATIEACYVPASGTIYRINTAASPAPGAPNACLTPAHVRFTWNQQAPAGPAGAPGPQGPAGPAGSANYVRISSPATLAPGSYVAYGLTCTGGRRAVGGGLDLTAGPTVSQIVKVTTHESYPFSDTQWRIGVANMNSMSIAATVYVVCL